MTHIKFPHVSANLVRTTNSQVCDSGLNNIFNRCRGYILRFSLWETTLWDNTAQDEGKQKYEKKRVDFSKQMESNNKAQP